MAVFDTAALLDALARPVFRHEGREWVGRHLSIHELLRVSERLESAGALTLLEAQRLYRDLADEIFPPTPMREARSGWLGLRRRLVPPEDPSVADVLESLPFAVQSELIADFIGRQVTAGQAPAPGRETRDPETRTMLERLKETLPTSMAAPRGAT